MYTILRYSSKSSTMLLLLVNALTLLGWCEAWDQYTQTLKIWEGTITLLSYPMVFCVPMPSAMLFFTNAFLIDEVLLSHNKYFSRRIFSLVCKMSYFVCWNVFYSFIFVASNLMRRDHRFITLLRRHSLICS